MGASNWLAAIAACEGKSYAGYTDWRLPNVRELMSIVDYNNFSPTIDPIYFPGTRVTNPYWSSTTHAPDVTYAWFVDFSNGTVYTRQKTNTSCYVRCVRGP